MSSVARVLSGGERWSHRLTLVASTYVAYMGILIVLLIAATSVQSLFTTENLSDVAKQASILGLVAIGQTFVLLVRGFDLSVGAVVGLSAITVTQVAGNGGAGGMLRGIGLALAFGVAIGLINGGLVTKRSVPPFIATLGMLIFVQGARLAYTRGQTSGSVAGDVRSLAQDSILGVPAPIVIWLGLSLGFAVLLYRTPYGRRVYAVGLNPAAARLSGIRVDAIIISAFVISSVLSVVAGLLLAGYIGYVDQYVGTGSDLDSITAALIGGTSFAGGRGGLGGTIAGVVFLTLLLNIIVIAGLSVQLQSVTKGAILVAAVVLLGLRHRGATQEA